MKSFKYLMHKCMPPNLLPAHLTNCSKNLSLRESTNPLRPRPPVSSKALKKINLQSQTLSKVGLCMEHATTCTMTFSSCQSVVRIISLQSLQFLLQMYFGFNVPIKQISPQAELKIQCLSGVVLKE